MVRKGYTPEQIIGKLGEAKILLSQAVDTPRFYKESTNVLHYIWIA